MIPIYEAKLYKFTFAKESRKFPKILLFISNVSKLLDFFARNFAFRHVNATSNVLELLQAISSPCASTKH